MFNESPEFCGQFKTFSKNFKKKHGNSRNVKDISKNPKMFEI